MIFVPSLTACGRWGMSVMDNSLLAMLGVLSADSAGHDTMQIPKWTRPEPVPLTPEQQRNVDGFRARRIANKTKGKA